MQNEFRLDLHTHSIISYDGGINERQYRNLLQKDPQFFVAITDHNEISLAIKLQQEFPDQIIVGEEIMTVQGEIIGLYLYKKIEPKQGAQETITHIKEQGGLVYIPHPFERSRKGIGEEDLKKIVDSIDILEVYNARTREPWVRSKVKEFAEQHNIAQATSSDAHGLKGIGSAYSIVIQPPSKENLKDLLKSANYKQEPPPLLSFLDPMRNKFRNLFR